MIDPNQSTDFWSLLIYGGLAVAIAAGMLIISYLLGEKHRDQATNEPYESGIESTDSARLKFPVRFYIIAMFFVIFDLEAIFIVSWAIGFKELGWSGYLGVAVFIGILLAVFVYEWSIGALDFGPDGNKIIKAYRKLKNSKS